VEGAASLEEVERHWSLEDVADANDALDAWQEAKAAAHKKK
jgi:hypothetical protein